jgi:flagellar motor component MotA
MDENEMLAIAAAIAGAIIGTVLGVILVFFIFGGIPT